MGEDAPAGVEVELTCGAGSLPLLGADRDDAEGYKAKGGGHDEFSYVCIEDKEQGG